MGNKPLTVVDANVLLNLATPVVDGRDKAPTGSDPFKAVLVSYDVHVPNSVMGEFGNALGGDDLLAYAAQKVLTGSAQITSHDVDGELTAPLDYGLDEGESDGIWLANELNAELFITDEFNSTNYLLVNLALDDRNTLFTTPHVLCKLATSDILPREYVDALLSYYVDTKSWDSEYIRVLRKNHLHS